MPPSRKRKKKKTPTTKQSDSTQKTETKKPPRPQNQPQKLTLKDRYWFRAVSWCIAFVVAVVGLVAGVDDVWGPIWPTDPAIHPQDTINASSLILPFTMKNKSVLFSIHNAEVTCVFGQLYMRNDHGDAINLPDIAFDSGFYSIATDAAINVPCNATDFASFNMHGSAATIEKVCVWITADYRIFGVPHHSVSTVFQWPATPGQNQWLEGPAYHVGPPVTYSAADYGNPIKVVDCSPTAPETYKRLKNGNLEIIHDGKVIETR